MSRKPKVVGKEEGDECGGEEHDFDAPCGTHFTFHDIKKTNYSKIREHELKAWCVPPAFIALSVQAYDSPRCSIEGISSIGQIADRSIEPPLNAKGGMQDAF
ncbi:hypothetical protein [Pelagicoccus sp. SDUM812003]|uniref:hypothetical protein n=1 Tax=Pelagicoccus sp. SDUM812003 TaxID=3041267 RepID=UPI00280C8041|nr:hypothetical protein [Pelagicoccus sp. SDUM812003]MDQ8201812.1 hypothetical protein [Pelagicoccus sp. SDUM812003]